MNIYKQFRIFKILLNYLNPTILLVKFLFLWACDRLEFEVVEYMIECKIKAFWDDQMMSICHALFIQLRGVFGDTPLHFVFRRQCKYE